MTLLLLTPDHQRCCAYSLLCSPDLQEGVIAMPLTPAADGKLVVRVCNFSDALTNVGPATWRFLAI